MNPVELQKPDGTPAGILYCSECGRIFPTQTREYAERCCNRTCETCGASIANNWGYTICDTCLQAKWAREAKEKLDAAEKLETWDGWVFFDGLSHRDGFCESLDELEEMLEDEEWPPEKWPEYVHTCLTIPVRAPRLESILEDVTVDMYEDAYDDLCGVEELGKALKAFEEANKDVVTYFPNYKQAVRVPKPEAMEEANA